ncbi:hypothetical protein KMI12_158 [Klebsiella phage KMI12]|jgi:hypothetical protein|uniref:Uncharacterized protein n=2 Tax=Viruses TaxID=10239 RepID=A0A5Q2F9Y7_9CAUD|nr:hypothetical protein [Klebsiella variicola]PXM06499.1 hypothetical protein DMT40_17925 [Klebsiella variicola]QEG11082.1 hypothetical protein KMI12_158 [Klebsiella phage KMI12]QGF21655.1 hypothetical protein JIPhKp122_0242 [Klebsiella phage JIPh_Kp122]UYL06029.1 hypothetical protein MMDGKJEO_00197 [Klebsiella phage KP13MC5-5]
MGKLNIDIVATPIINKDGICVDLEYADGTRFYDTDHGIDFDLIMRHGPGGGWPNIDLRGSREKVIAYLESLEWDDIDYFMEDFEE